MQEDVVAIKFAGRLFLIAGAGLSGFLLPRFGPWKMFMVGSMFTAAAPVCLITLGQWGPWAEKLMSGIAAAIRAPVQLMYLSAILQQNDLTRVQIALVVTAVPIAILSTLIYPQLFFGSKVCRFDCPCIQCL